MVQFYNFKIKAEKVRNNLNEDTAELALKEEIQDEAVVCNTVQIVRSYIAKHSITEIRVEQSLQRLIISPKQLRKAIPPIAKTIEIPKPPITGTDNNDLKSTISKGFTSLTAMLLRIERQLNNVQKDKAVSSTVPSATLHGNILIDDIVPFEPLA